MIRHSEVYFVFLYFFMTGSETKGPLHLYFHTSVHIRVNVYFNV
jgi:hypothetical protein